MNKPEATTDSQKKKDIAADDTASVLHDAETTAASQAGIMKSFMLLKTGTANKLGQRSAGILTYHILADNDRLGLLIALTRNEGGGFFSRERVHFHAIVTCLEKYKSGTPFVSKVLKDIFVSKSANNAAFMAAVLRSLDLLAAAPAAETQHVFAGDWSAWEKAMLAETGTRIELPADIGDEKQVAAKSVPDHTERKKTLTLPRKKAS